MRRLFTIPVFTVVLSVLAARSVASPLVFTIDTAQSQISLAIQEPDGTPISSAQTLGSDTTSVAGSALVDVTGSSVQFLSTGDAQFAQQAAPQSPLANGSAGTAAAQYGLDILIPGIGGGTVAVRQLVGDVTSGVLPVAGGTFDATQLALQFLTGSVAYNLELLGNPIVGSADITFPVTNQLSGGTISLAGGVYTITIPLLAVGSDEIDGISVLGVYTGNIVATAVVPEPSGVVLALCGCGFAQGSLAKAPSIELIA